MPEPVLKLLHAAIEARQKPFDTLQRIFQPLTPHLQARIMGWAAAARKHVAVGHSLRAPMPVACNGA